MDKAIAKRLKRVTRHKRIRAKVKGTAERPRLAIYRSNRDIYAQLINDDLGVTLAAAKSSAELVKAAEAKKIKKVVFDRGGFIYAGRIKMFAEECRKAGLEF